MMLTALLLLAAPVGWQTIFTNDNGQEQYGRIERRYGPHERKRRMWVIAPTADEDMTTRTLFEVDCDRGFIRAVTGEAYDVDGNYVADIAPFPFEKVVPETNGAAIVETACRD